MTAVKNTRYSPRATGDEFLTAAQPRQLIVTIFGLYARENSNCLPIASVVRLMADLGVDGQAVRSSISRLKRRDALRSQSIDGTAGYALSPSMLEVMTEGDRRIFGQQQPDLADGWVQVVFTVPEAERGKRHELRTRLARLGFGPVAPGVWLAPGGLADEVREVLARRQLTGYVDIFRSDYLGYADLPSRVRDWWDLDDLAARYGQFLAHYRPVQRRIGRVATGRRRGIRRVRPDAHRLAPAALPRPRPAGAGAAAALGRDAGGGPVRRAERGTSAGRPPARAGCHPQLIPWFYIGISAMPCSSISAVSSHSRATPMPAIAGYSVPASRRQTAPISRACCR